jgi:hypothetical protein
MDVGFAKLTLSSFCGNRFFSMNIQFCYHLCCSILIFKKKSFSVYDDIFLSMIIFTHCSSSLMSSHDLCMLT